MLIVSKFHDYYDKAIGMGVDKTCVYQRQTREVRKPSSSHPVDLWLRSGEKVHAYPEVLGFCGHLFPLVKISWPLKNKHQCFYDLESWRAFLASNNHREPSFYITSSRLRILSKKGQAEFFNVNSHLKLEALFLEHRVPVFISGGGLILNPKLLDYDFQKIKDAFTAFQEIFMFQSGVLGTNENPVITLSDVDKRDKKGFDGWSFKTRPKNE